MPWISVSYRPLASARRREEAASANKSNLKVPERTMDEFPAEMLAGRGQNGNSAEVKATAGYKIIEVVKSELKCRFRIAPLDLITTD